MKRYEKLILIVVALLVLSRIGALARDIMLAHTYGTAPLPYDVERNWKLASLLITYAVNIGFAAWLYVDAVKNNVNRWIWTIFGLIFGIMGLAIFYLVQIFEELRTKSRAD